MGTKTIKLEVNKQTENEIIEHEFIKIGEIYYIRKDYVIKSFENFMSEKI